MVRTVNQAADRAANALHVAGNGAPPWARFRVRVLRLVALLLIVGLAWPSAVANAAQPATQRSGQALFEQAWRLAGLEKLSQTMSRNILTNVREHPDLAKLPPRRRARLVEQYERYATASRLSTTLRRHLQKASAADLRTMIAMTQSPVARLAVEQEMAFRPVPVAVMKQYEQSIRETEAGQVRTDAIRRLDAALGVSDISVTVAAASLYGTTVALNKLRDKETPKEMPKDAPKDAPGPDLSEAINQFASQIRGAQTEQIQLTYLYLYRRLAIDDLLSYVQLQESEPIRSMQRRLIQALGSEMIAIQDDVVRAIIVGDRPPAAQQI